MASKQEAQQALLDKITALAPNGQTEHVSRAILHLAEAYAWLTSPAQPHGGGPSVKQG